MRNPPVVMHPSGSSEHGEDSVLFARKPGESGRKKGAEKRPVCIFNPFFNTLKEN